MKSQVVLGEVYADYEKLIYSTVAKFIKRHGGDFEEFVSEANLVFLKCVDAFDAERGKFSTLLVNAIRNQLIRVRQADMQRQKRYNQLDDATNNVDWSGGVVADDHEQTAWQQITDDARQVLKLVAETPAELWALVNTTEKGKGRRWRRGLRSYLGFRGWSGERIDEAYEEISEALAVA